MKLLIVVPTKNRPDSFKRQTYRWLPLLGRDYKIFIEAEDRPKYDYLTDDELVILPESNKGLGYSLHQARLYALDHGYDVVFKCDDDMTNWNDLNRRTPADKEQGIKRILNQYIEDSLAEMQKQPRVAAVGLPYSNEMFDVKKFTYINIRLQSSYIVRTEFFAPNPKMSTFEDFYTSINIWYSGNLTLRYGLT